MEAAERMWALYEQMKAENVRMDTIIYSQLIEFLSLSKTRHMQERAYLLLQTMVDSKESDLQPDFRQYIAVINGWADFGDPEIAEHVLLQWIRAFRKDRFRVGKLMPANYEKVAKAWLRQDNIVRAVELIYKVKELLGAAYISDGPDIQTHQNILRAWKRSKHPEKEPHERTLKAAIVELRRNNKR